MATQRKPAAKRTNNQPAKVKAPVDELNPDLLHKKLTGVWQQVTFDVPYSIYEGMINDIRDQVKYNHTFDPHIINLENHPSCVAAFQTALDDWQRDFEIEHHTSFAEEIEFYPALVEIYKEPIQQEQDERKRKQEEERQRRQQHLEAQKAVQARYKKEEQQRKKLQALITEFGGMEAVVAKLAKESRSAKALAKRQAKAAEKITTPVKKTATAK